MPTHFNSAPWRRVFSLPASSAVQDYNTRYEADRITPESDDSSSQISLRINFRRFSAFDDRPVCFNRRTVVVSPLPNDMTVRDVFARVFGGAVAKVTLAQFKGVKAAVITFREPESAVKYSKLCKQLETTPWALPALATNKASGDKTVAMVIVPVLNHPLQHDTFEPLLTPYLCSPFRQLVKTATRCILIKNVPLNKLQEIWSVVGLAGHLRDPHYRFQIEDIWLDRPAMHTVDGQRIVHMNMHIWFTSVGMAHAARIQQSYSGQFGRHEDVFKPWTQSISFEDDPCMALAKPSGGSGVGFTWSSHGHTSLISLHDVGQLEKLFGMLEALPRTLGAATLFGSSSSSSTFPDDDIRNNLFIRNASRRLPSKSQLQVWKGRNSAWRNDVKKFAEEQTASCADDYCPGLAYARRARNNGFTALEDQEYALHLHHHMLDVRRPKCFLSTLDVFSSLVPSRSAYCPGPPEAATQEIRPRSDYQLEMLTALAVQEQEKQHQNAASAEGTTAKQYPDYSRNNWEAGIQASKDKYAYYWTIGVEEYCSLTPEQLREFGGPGYVPPPGFTTIKKHLTRLSSA